jgi:hypothetical protein
LCPRNEGIERVAAARSNAGVKLSKAIRELISRTAALLLGLALCYGSAKCFIWTYKFATDPVLDQMISNNRSGMRRTTGNAAPFVLPVGLGVLLGAGGLAFIGFALIPTKTLYSIDPMYDQTDLDE